MKLITLSRSGSIIDLDSVTYVKAALSQGSPKFPGITIGLGGHEEFFGGDDAHQFLTALNETHRTEVDTLLKRTPGTGSRQAKQTPKPEQR